MSVKNFKIGEYLAKSYCTDCCDYRFVLHSCVWQDKTVHSCLRDKVSFDSARSLINNGATASVALVPLFDRLVRTKEKFCSRLNRDVLHVGVTWEGVAN